MNLIWRQNAALGKNVLLLLRQCSAARRLSALIFLFFTTREFLNFFADSNAAPIVSAHRAEIRINIKILVVIRTRHIWIEGQLEMLFPIQRCTRLRQFIIAVARSRNPKRNIRSMRCDLVRDTPLLHIIFLW